MNRQTFFVATALLVITAPSLSACSATHLAVEGDGSVDERDAGTDEELDAGRRRDAGRRDGGGPIEPGEDAGEDPIEEDAGPIEPGEDAGEDPIEIDAGPRRDAGPVRDGGPRRDAGGPTVSCGMETCGGGEICCATFGGGGGPGGGVTQECTAPGDCDDGIALSCDGPDDCGAGEACCAQGGPGGGPRGTSCVDEDDCDMGRLCGDDSDCEGADRCCTFMGTGICAPRCF